MKFVAIVPPRADGPHSAGSPVCQISLVVPTIGRTTQIRRLLASLARQRGVIFEVIVVDQNEDERLARCVAGVWPFPLVHLRCPDERGASRARNRGVALACAPILLFPDDDAWYPADFLANGLARIEQCGADILTGRSTNEAGRTINGRYAPAAGPISRRGVWTRQSEWITFIRHSRFAALGGFDETVGVGAATPWQAGEGPDLILRAIDQGATAWYDPALVAFHEELPTRRPDRVMVRKGLAYARGMGRVLRRRGFSPLALLYWCGRALIAALRAALARDRQRCRYYLLVSLGRLEGYVGHLFLRE